MDLIQTLSIMTFRQTPLITVKMLHSSIILMATLGLLASAVADPESATAKIAASGPADGNYRLTDWTAVRMNTKWVPKYATFQGYLSFEGTGDFPSVTLWDTRENLEQKKAFCDIAIESASACKIINRKFGRGANNWKVMHGLYVEISGEFERQEEGFEYTGLGRLSGIKEIAIYNNGLVLLLLKPEGPESE